MFTFLFYLTCILAIVFVSVVVCFLTYVVVSIIAAIYYYIDLTYRGKKDSKSS